MARATEGLIADTIAAVATPPGKGAVGLVRISGPEAGGVIRRIAPGLFQGNRTPEERGPANQERRARPSTDAAESGPGVGSAPEPGAVGSRDLRAVAGATTGLVGQGAPAGRTVHLTEIRDPDTGEVMDRALVVLFPAPGSYTGEDVVEVSGHGGVLAPRLILEAALRAGAREAEPGEFTRRAYLNGKLDLVQAEAVLDLVEGRSRALHRVAVHQLERGLSQRIGSLRAAVLELEALLAHHLDFPEEDSPPTPVSVIGNRGAALADALEALARTAPEGGLLRRGALGVLAGAPNVGKSSLFNALVGEERVLVTPVAGTTRDAVEVEVSLGGFPFRLVDTAGLRETEEAVERMGIEVANRYLDSADVVVFCVEAGVSLTDAELAFLSAARSCPVVLVRTKVDVTGGEVGEGSGDLDSRPEAVVREVAVSARDGQGLDRLRHALSEVVFSGAVQADPEAPFITRERQARQVRAAESEVRCFVDALHRGIPPEVASAHLKSATTHLESVLGVVSGEDVLDHLFRQFCIGK